MRFTLINISRVIESDVDKIHKIFQYVGLD